MTKTVVARAPGKVNLFLQVGPLGADGYHPLVTVFQAVDLYEEVAATKLPVGSGIVITASGPGSDQVPLDNSNLAAKAALALATRIGIAADVSLHLEKGVPVAGGMAGGSADAAAALLACNELWQAGLPVESLSEIAAELGSDVPFSLLGGTALGTGRGHLLTPIPTSLVLHWAFAIQDTGLSTPSVFRKFDEPRLGSEPRAWGDSASAPFRLAQNNGRVPFSFAQNDGGVPFEFAENHGGLSFGFAQSDSDIGKLLTNDLQVAALALRPELAETIRAAEEAGALGVIVSGSGPTIAALAASGNEAQSIADNWLATGTASNAIVTTGPARGAHIVH